MVLPRHDREMPEPLRAAVAQLHIIGVYIQRNRTALRNGQVIFSRQELAPLNEHPLTAPPHRGDATILRSGNKAVAYRENCSCICQHDTAAQFLTLELDIV